MSAPSALQYQANSAGRVMTVRIPVVGLEAMISDVERMLSTKHQHFQTINYIYVVDRIGELCGVLSIKDVFRLPKMTKVIDAMQSEVISVPDDASQKDAAMLALRHNLKAVPVIDEQGRLLGVVPSDTILAVVHHYAGRDLLQRAGVHRMDPSAADVLSAPVFMHVKKRLPWLLVGVVGGTAAALIVSRFETVIGEEILLAAFIPPVVYLVDAVSTQSEILFVHAAALRERIPLKAYLAREVRVSAILAAVLATTFAAVAYIGFGSAMVSATIAAALLVAVTISAVVAVLLPWALIRLRRDPAVSSGPFVTIVSDLLAIVIYFISAEIMLRLFS